MTINVSVVMATYNGATFLREQLDSLAAQTHLPVELVVTDDNSTDATAEIVATFAKVAPFAVRFETNARRLGYRRNFQRAMALASGDIVCFCDQDDIWLQSKVASVITAFTDDAVTLFHHNATLVNRQAEPFGALWNKPPMASFTPALGHAPWFLAPGFTIAYRRNVVEGAPFWADCPCPDGGDRMMAHDHWVSIVAGTVGTSVYSDEKLVLYRLHGTNTSPAWSTPPGRFTKLRYQLENRSEVFARLAVIADSMAVSFRMSAAAIPPHFSENAVRAADLWVVLAKMYRTRTQIYTNRSLLGRARAMIRLIRDHGYNGFAAWSFGAKGRAKDALLGVLLGPLTKRFGFRPVGGDPSCVRGRGMRSSNEFRQELFEET